MRLFFTSWGPLNFFVLCILQVPEPMDFSMKNYMSLVDQQNLLIKLVRPDVQVRWSSFTGFTLPSVLIRFYICCDMSSGYSYQIQQYLKKLSGLCITLYATKINKWMDETASARHGGTENVFVTETITCNIYNCRQWNQEIGICKYHLRNFNPCSSFLRVVIYILVWWNSIGVAKFWS